MQLSASFTLCAILVLATAAWPCNSLFLSNEHKSFLAAKHAIRDKMLPGFLKGLLGAGTPGMMGAGTPGMMGAGTPGMMGAGMPGMVGAGMPGMVGAGMPGMVGAGMPGMMPQTVATPGVPVPIAAAPPAAPENSLVRGAQDKLDQAMKDMKTAMKENEFFQIGKEAMKIRELAVENPSAMKGAGVIVVEYSPKTSNYSTSKQDLEAAGRKDLKKGNSQRPCAALQRRAELEARKEYDEMMSPINQKDLEASMNPGQEMAYESQRLAQIKHEIAVQRQVTKNAAKEMQKNAKAREQ